MSNDLLEKVVLITGAGSGIGRACAILLAQSGAKVVVSDIVEKGGVETVAMIRESGGEATFIKTDISQSDQVQSLINQVLEQYGRLDCAVNNAGVEGKGHYLVKHDIAEFDRIIKINLRGTFLCMKYEIAAMLKQGSGSIVNIASILGLVGRHATAGYCASKHGIIGMTKSAALDNAQTGIRINAACPGVIDTPLARRNYGDTGMPAKTSNRIPFGRAGQPEEVAQAVKWLCSSASSYVTGTCLTVDGGITIQ